MTKDAVAKTHTLYDQGGNVWNTTPPGGQLAAPSSVMANPGDTIASVSWAAVTDATNYDVRYWVTANGEGSATDSIGVGASPHTIESLTNDTQYSVRVRATASGFTASNWSAAVTVTPTAASPGTYTFPLPAGHFIPARMPMTAVFPRPDNETAAHARQKWAHPDMVYELDIGVQGGAWPFRYEIITGPAGASIGQDYPDANYGVLTWTAPSSGTNIDFTVRVTDQELNTVDLSWQVDIDATPFVFIEDVNGSSAGAGTINDPLEDWDDWFKGDVNDSTYHNKIIVFRGGNYTLVGDAVNNNGNVNLDTSTKTAMFIRFPGETPVLECSGAKIVNGSSGNADIFCHGLTFQNARSADITNAHFWWALGSGTVRSYWCANTFDSIDIGTDGDDNTCCVFVSSTSSNKPYHLYRNNHHNDVQNAGFNGSIVEQYNTSYWVCELNTVANSSVNQGFYAKSCEAFVSLRANVAVDNCSCAAAMVGVGHFITGTTPHDQEVCWNRVVAGANDNVLLIADSSNWADQSYNEYVYRNTFVGESAWVRFEGLEPYGSDANIVVRSNTARWDETIMTIGTPNLLGSAADSIVDANGLLQGSYRDQYLGTRGAEVSA